MANLMKMTIKSIIKHYILVMCVKDIKSHRYGGHYVQNVENLGYDNLFAKGVSLQLLLTMTSSNGNIFRVIGPLCGEFTGDRSIPRTKASDVEL